MEALHSSVPFFPGKYSLSGKKDWGILKKHARNLRKYLFNANAAKEFLWLESFPQNERLR